MQLKGSYNFQSILGGKSTMEVDNDVLFPFGQVITHKRMIIGILIKLINTYDSKNREQVNSAESS